jgi:serine/threonine-protein kinase
MELDSGAIVDRYRVVGVLGHGGMASVYHVQHTKLSSDHVLKVLSLPGRGIRDRLLLEGQVQARLKHRNVVEVTDVIEVQGSPGLVMELVRGPALDAVLEHGPLELERVEELVPGILAGVQAAHEEGVVHRDLKPANILLAVQRGRVVPKVADFGLVKIVDETEGDGRAKTRTGATMGTPQYMAPEQIQSARTVDARADIFALGAILYELVAGERAFDGDSHYEVFQAVVERQVAPLKGLRPDVPDRMVRAIEAALQDVDERPSTAEALWELWRADDTPLDEAASRAPKWPAPLLDRLDTLTPSLDTLGGATPFSGSSDGSGPSSDSAPATFHADPLEPIAKDRAPPTSHDLTASEMPTDEIQRAPAAPIEPPPAPRLLTLPFVAVIAVALLAASALVLTTGVVAGMWTVAAPAPAPVHIAAPAPTAPVPSVPPVAVPEPSPAEPEPSPAEPEPSPAPIAAAPKPVKPSRPAPPTPADAAPTGSVTALGGIAVTLIAADGSRHSVGTVPTGVYTIEGAFTEGASTVGTVEIQAGQTYAIECTDGLRTCRVK